MEVKRSKEASLLLWSVMAALLSQNLVVPVMSVASFDDQKTYPNTRTPPTVSLSPPPHGSGGGHATPTPSHGGGGYGGTPPGNCGNPPSGGHRPTTPSPPRGGRGGGYHSPPTPIDPTPPTGGYYNTPPTSTPITPTTPTPIVESPPPPTTPIDPGTPSTPGISVPSPPFAFDPNSPPGLGANMNLLQALSNTRTDGFGGLYREGTAALLNSMAHTRFPYTTSQVRDSFVAALGSNRAAAAQAQLFKLANEGRTKPRA